MSKEKSRFVVG